MAKNENTDGNSSIKCDVETCAHHNDENDLCELDSIKVSAIDDEDEVTDYEETVCQSYKCDKSKCECNNNDNEE